MSSSSPPSPSSSNAPHAPRAPPRRRRSRIAGMSSYLIFVGISAWKIMFSSDNDASIIVGDPSTSSDPGNGAMSSSSSSATPVTRVLIVRTMSPSETSIVIEDALHVKSFYRAGERHRELLAGSRANCPALKEAGYAASLDPHAGGSASFPNHLLCAEEGGEGGEDMHMQDNNYLAVKADFMLFARNEEHARNVSETIELLSKGDDALELEGQPPRGIGGSRPYHDVDVDVRDVSRNPMKIWNWILHCTEERLQGYDYVWFVDGDISLKSLNWQAFWQQVKLMRPKITQPASLGDGPDGHSSVHASLRYLPDSRVMAAEVPIVEVQAPLLETKTWVDYRNFLANDPEPMERFEVGGEQCFDMAWCHSAKNNLTGNQGNGGIVWIGHREGNRELSPAESSHYGGRACVVLYQTPIVHVSKFSRGGLVTNGDFKVATHLLCRYFRLKLGVIGKQGLKTVYELFNAPKPVP